MTLHYDSEKLRLSFDYDENNIILAKSIGGRWNKTLRSWTFEPSQISRVMEVFNLKDENLTQVAKALRDGAKILLERREEIRVIKNEKKEVALELPKNYVFVTEPYKHQIQGLALAYKFPSFALLLDMGTGKTKIAIDLFRLRYKLGQVEKMIVVCPKSVIGVWQDEVSKHSLIKEDSVFSLPQVVKKTKSSRTDVLKRFLNEKKSKFFILNYDSLLTFDSVSDIMQNPSKLMLTIDESTRVKNPSAKRTKIVHSLCKLIPYRLIMSGVLIPNNLLDVYSQWYCIDQGEAFGQTFTAFKRNYFFSDKFGFNYYPKSGTRDFISSVIDSQSYRVRKEECLDLPPSIYETRNIEMTESQSRIYSEIATTMLAQIEKDRVVCSVALTKLIKLAEITSGFVISNEGKVLNLENPKLDALMDILDEIQEHKVVIFAVHHHSIEHIIEAIKTRNNQSKECVVALYGKTSNNAKDIVNKFQTDEKCRYLVAHPGSGGIGITLTAAKYVVYFSNDYNMENRYQSESRVHRIGAEKWDKITYIDLIVKKSIDQSILNSLKNKFNLMKKVVDYKRLVFGDIIEK